MRNVFRTSLVGALAALTFGLGVAATASPASAQIRPHFGGHGFGGHAWHGGGGGWHGGGRNWGPAVGLGVLGGLAAGAIIANQGAYYGNGYYADDGCQQYRAVYDNWGNYMGRRLVDVCY